MIVIVDTGTGNLQSVARALAKVGADAVISSTPRDVAAAAGIILPGVGSAASAMAELAKADLLDVLEARVRRAGVPTLGICLGQQLLVDASDEGGVTTFGWIPGRVRRLPPPATGSGLRVPHLGWGAVTAVAPHSLLHGVDAEACFYFAHSYYVETEDAFVAAYADYGTRFAAAVQRDNIYGVQFHPEKSQANGLTVLRNFAERC